MSCTFRPPTALKLAGQQVVGLPLGPQAVPAPWHPNFPGQEWAAKYTEFKPDLANKMLDALGLTKRDPQLQFALGLFPDAQTLLDLRQQRQAWARRP